MSGLRPALKGIKMGVLDFIFLVGYKAAKRNGFGDMPNFYASGYCTFLIVLVCLAFNSLMRLCNIDLMGGLGGSKIGYLIMVLIYLILFYFIFYIYGVRKRSEPLLLKYKYTLFIDENKWIFEAILILVGIVAFLVIVYVGPFYLLPEKS